MSDRPNRYYNRNDTMKKPSPAHSQILKIIFITTLFLTLSPVLVPKVQAQCGGCVCCNVGGGSCSNGCKEETLTCGFHTCCRWNPVTGCISGDCCICGCGSGGGDGGGGDTPAWDARGTILKFIQFDQPSDVTDWPVTSTTGASAWLEYTPTTGFCANPAASTQLQGIKASFVVTGRPQASDYRTSFANMSPYPIYPVCTDSHNVSYVQAVFYEHEPNFYPTWHNSLTRIVIPGTTYRQFGIKILNGVDFQGDSTGSNRPVYHDYYTWLNHPNDSTPSHIHPWTEDGSPITSISYPGFPGIGAVIPVGSGIRDDKGRQKPIYNINGWYSNYGTREKGNNDQWEDECENTQGSCPTGYTGIQATATIDPECVNKPALYTCKKVVEDSGESYISNWKPEKGSNSISLPQAWNSSDNKQTFKIYQTFDFTVDIDGYYYFVTCPPDGLFNNYYGINPCHAHMTVRYLSGGGTWNGFNNHSYNAGSTYRALFECWSGDCYYGLGIAPKNDLPDLSGTAGLYKDFFVPIVSTISPPGNIVGKFIDASTNRTCAYINATAANISARINLTGPQTLTSTGQTFSFPNVTTSATTPYTFTLSNIPASYLNPGNLYCKTSTLGNPVGTTSTASFNLLANDTITVNIGLVRNNDAWWQTQDGDILAGSVDDRIPSTVPAGQNYVSLAGVGDYPGVIAYSGTSGTYRDDAVTTTNSGHPSENNWLVDQNPPSVNVSYSILEKRAEDKGLLVTATGTSVTPDVLRNKAPNDDHYHYIKYGNTLTISSGNLNLGTRKLVLFVDGDLTINATNVTVTNGSGFVAFIVSGDININPLIAGSQAAPGLEGVYFADGNIDTGSRRPTADSHLWGYGSFIGLGGIRLGRDLDPANTTGANNTTPGETLIFDPAVFLTFPDELRDSNFTWEQVQG